LFCAVAEAAMPKIIADKNVKILIIKSFAQRK
jgi:hypothetical protein